MLSEPQHMRIRELLALLAIYTNERFDLVDEDQPELLMGSGDPHRLTTLRELMSTTWEHVDLIDDFVAENPFDLPGEDLDIVCQWKDALPCLAFFVGTEDGRELYLTEGRLIAVEQSEPRGSSPRLVDFTILPFENTIVEDYCGIAMEIDSDGLAPMDLEGDLARAREVGVIRTAAEFVAFARRANEQRHAAELEKLLEDVSREARSRAGEDISPAGFHRGILAGLAPELREKTVHEEAIRIAAGSSGDNYLASYALKGEPGATLSDCLLGLNKEAIAHIGRSFGV